MSSIHQYGLAKQVKKGIPFIGQPLNCLKQTTSVFHFGHGKKWIHKTPRTQ